MRNFSKNKKYFFQWLIRWAIGSLELTHEKKSGVKNA